MRFEGLGVCWPLMRLTLLKAKEFLARKAPVELLNFRLNRTCERYLLNDKFTVGSLKNILVTVPFGQLTLPRQYRTVEGIKVDGAVYALANHWWEYLPGKTDTSGFSLAMVRDIGDGHATIYDLPLDGNLKVDYDGSETLVTKVYGEGADGMPLTITFNGKETKPNTLISINRVRKEQGDVSVLLTHVADDATVTTLAPMWPREEETYYRRYMIDTKTSCPEVTVKALVKIRHIEFTNDDDVLPISNLSALEQGLDALQMESENDPSAAEKYWAIGISILNGELNDTNAEGAAPTMRFLYPGGVPPRLSSHY